MNYELNRSLTVLADGDVISGFRRARLTGHDSLGLYPMPFVLRLWNLAEADYLLLCSAKVLSVRSGDSVLASGTVSDVCRRAVPEGRVTEAVFAAGLNLWEAPVSLSVEAGTSVSETVRRILAESGTGISLLSFPVADPVRSRPELIEISRNKAAQIVFACQSSAADDLIRKLITIHGVLPAIGC